MISNQPTTERSVDERLSELIGQHAVRYISGPATPYPVDAVVEPAGMSLADEEELSILMQLADAGLDGDEEAAIERLVAVLDEARRRAH